MNLRFLAALLWVVPAGVRAQVPDHIDPPAVAAGNAPGADPTTGDRSGRGGEMMANLDALIANPVDLERGRKLFAAHCVQCHGPKGEGDRGPMLAQPRLPRANNDVNLIRIVGNGIAGTEMPNPNLQPGEAPYVAAYVKSLGRIPQEKVNGDPARGAELVKTKGACFTCHSANGQGMAIGPDLTDIGLRRSVAFLRRSLTEPGAEVPQSFSPFRQDISLPMNFMFVQVKTSDGQEFAGVRVNESVFSIQIRDITGRVHSFFKSELAELKKNKGMSPMPVYAGVFTPAEMDDVIAYLVSMKGDQK